jgi:hypothetical protein
METNRKADLENLKRMMGGITNANQAKTNAKLKEITKTIEETQMELQTAEVSLDARTRKLQENLARTFNKTCSAIEVTKREFQARLEAVEARTERGSTAIAGASAAQPTTFNGNTSWSVFQRQYDIVAEHNHWSDREKSTYIICALKGRAADVLPGIPTNSTNEDALQALEDCFGAQHFAAAYRCQLTTRTQKAGKSLQDLQRPFNCLPIVLTPFYPNTT